MTKNPKRVEAGRRNRAKRGPLSAETRELFSQLAHENRPWEKSTGPRTAKGKARSSKNRSKANQEVALPQPPLVAKAKALLTQASDIRKSIVIDPQSAQVMTGESTEELLQGILGSVHSHALRREVDSFMEDAFNRQGNV